MTEKEFVDKVCAASAGTQLRTHCDIAITALSVAKEAGAKFESRFPERLQCDGKGVYGACPNGDNEMLTLADYREVCRRYNDRTEVEAMIRELVSAAGQAMNCGGAPTLSTRVSAWLSKELP